MKKSKLVILVLIALFFLIVVLQYNALIKTDIDICNNWCEIENQMQRRIDLIPDLIKIAKKVMIHEKDLINNITDARKKLSLATKPADQINASSELDIVLSRLLIAMENYPQIKSNETYIRLMDEIAGTENRIAISRKNYNISVSKYMLKLRTIPSAWFAKIFGFKSKTYYNIFDLPKEKPEYDL